MLTKTSMIVVLLLLLGLGLGYISQNYAQTITVTIQLRRGVNLDAWLQYPPFAALDNSHWPELQAIAQAGFDHVRLPINPQFIIDQQLAGAFSDSLTLFLQKAKANQLKVLVALAPEDELQLPVLQGGAALDVYLVALEKIAQSLANSDPKAVALELMTQPFDPQRDDCEPSGFDWSGMQNKLLQAARRGAKHLTIVVSGLCYGHPDSLAYLKPLADANLLYSFQYFERNIFAKQGAAAFWLWKELSGIPYPAKSQTIKALLPALLKRYPEKQRAQAQDKLERYGSSGFDAKVIAKELANAKAWADKNRVRLYLNAFGVRQSAPASDRAQWLGDVRSAAEKLALPWTVWSWQGEYGLLAGKRPGAGLDGAVKKVLGLR
jgi:endoglucanase